MSVEIQVRFDQPQRLAPSNRRAGIDQSALAFVGEPNTLQELVASGAITDADARDLLTFHRMLEEAFELRQRESAVADQIELQRASVKLSPPDQLQFAAKKLESLRAEAIAINSASQFLSTQNYYLPEFFEYYVPKVVVLRRKQSV